MTEEVFDFLAPAEGPGEIGRLGPYRVMGPIGAGGMGIVFRAEDPLLRRQVALKVMKRSLSAGAEARRRFLREAQAVAALDHDHVVAIYQAGEDRGILFLAMPLLQGETLSSRLRREGKLPLAEALRVAREVAEGLDVAHRRGLVHRDIKPANLWLEGGRGRVKILDFGLSRSLEPEADRSQSGQIAGTPHYMSPEQASGGPVTPLCDLFSLGCVLYQMTTGRLPFDGPDATRDPHGAGRGDARAARSAQPRAAAGRLRAHHVAAGPRPLRPPGIGPRRGRGDRGHRARGRVRPRAAPAPPGRSPWPSWSSWGFPGRVPPSARRSSASSAIRGSSSSRRPTRGSASRSSEAGGW